MRWPMNSLVQVVLRCSSQPVMADLIEVRAIAMALDAIEESAEYASVVRDGFH